jgi:hypothetical protein
LEDSSLTERQFNRCLGSLIQIVDRVAIPRLKEVMKTGQDPANIDMGERLLLSIQEQAPGLLELLERAMEARKKRGRFLSEGVRLLVKIAILQSDTLTIYYKFSGLDL